MSIDQKNHGEFRIVVVKNGFDEKWFFDIVYSHEDFVPKRVDLTIFTSFFFDLINIATLIDMIDRHFLDGRCRKPGVA